MVETLEIVAVGIAAGLLSGMFGVGGGILFVPALVFVADLSQIEAAATSLAAMIPVVAVGTWRQHRYGNVNARAAVVIGLTSAAGVAAGTAVAEVCARGNAEEALRCSSLPDCGTARLGGDSTRTDADRRVKGSL